MHKQYDQLLDINHNIQFYLSGFSPYTKLFYWSFIGIFLCSIGILPFCYVNVITRTEGIIRPFEERTVVRSLVSGTIQFVYCKDGGRVKKGDTLLILEQPNYQGQKKYLTQKILQCKARINDLKLLTQHEPWSDSSILQNLKTSLYQSQYLHFKDQLQEKNLISKKLQKDMRLYDPLVREKIIAANELADIGYQLLQSSAGFQSYISQQISRWESELLEEQKQLTDAETEKRNLLITTQSFVIKSPISGTILIQDPLYVGSSIQASSELLSISPEHDLIVECWMPPAALVTLYQDQNVTYTIPEIRNQMSIVLQGKVISIAKDYTLINNRPMFKVRCSLNQKQVELKNGFSYLLGKGLLLETRFLLARKSCWELLYQQLYDWFNPATLTKSTV